MKEYPYAIVANLKSPKTGIQWILYDALVDKTFSKFLLRSIVQKRCFKGKFGEISALPTRVFRKARGEDLMVLDPTPLGVEQSNTSIIYGDRFILKLFRRLEWGPNPDLEIGRFLTEKTPFEQISQVAGSLEYYRKRSKSMILAIFQSYINNEGDAWQYTLDSLERYFPNVLTHQIVQAPPIPLKHLLSLPEEPPPLAQETIGPYLTSAQLLGQRTAEMHIALASGVDEPDFVPDYFTHIYQTSLYQSMRSFTIKTLQTLKEQLKNIPKELMADAQQVLGLERDIIECYQPIRKEKISALRLRCHGDYHLGQVLFTGKDFVIIDFEGEPARSLSERRLKRSPLSDVAGMIRSFHYASHSALIKQIPLAQRPEDDLPLLQHWAQYWYVWVSVSFLKSYLGIVQPVGIIPNDPNHLRILLDAYILEKAIYEIGYELNNRPDWIKVPLQGILQIMEARI
jgi:maltose alpha-D-glucosyltransferase/alpha-amylase